MIRNLKNAIPKLLATIPETDDEANTELLFLKKIDSFFPEGKKRGREQKRKIVIEVII